MHPDKNEPTDDSILTEDPETVSGRSVAEHTGERSHNTVLIVDDDENFQRLLQRILSERGYEVWSAKSEEEATAFVQDGAPAIAVVNYQLPRTNGISWIKKMRQAGRHFPIIFCTGAWVDQTTFKFLRNLLHVSLIVQKPIVPDVFVHGLEAIVPPPSGARRFQSGTTDSVDESNFPRPTEQSLARSAAQQTLAEARQEFILALPSLWQDVVALTKQAIDNKEQTPLWQQASAAAHKLKGSSGSFGFVRVSETCSKLEEFFSYLDPKSGSLQELIWSEIERCIEEGTSFVLTAFVGPEDAPSHRRQAISLLAVTPDQSHLMSVLKLLDKDSDDLEIDFANCTLTAEMKCRRNRYDALLVDLSVDPDENRLGTVSTLRCVPGYLRVPLLLATDGSVKESFVIHAGASMVLDSSADADVVNESLNVLKRICKVRKQRILCIDDDVFLTNFVQSILVEEGFGVQSLNEPINTLDVVDQYEPDLILVDLIMPGLCGFDVCRSLRAHNRSAKTPILVLTAKYDQMSRSLAYQSGANDFISKPILKDELLARIRAHLPQLSECTDIQKATLMNSQDFSRLVTKVVSELDSRSAAGTLLLFSIDDSSELDGKYGAFASRLVTSLVSETIQIRFRPEDIRAQLAPDRFAVFVPFWSVEQVQEVAAALVHEFEQVWRFGIKGVSFQPRISAALAQSGRDGHSADELLQHCIKQIRQLNTQSSQR